MVGWLWHQLDHMQIICTSTQTNNHASTSSLNFWTTVCKTVRPVLSHRCPVCLSCLSVLSVTFVHCDQTVGQIKVKLVTQVSLGPGHIVLDGDPAPTPKGAKPPPIFGHFRPMAVMAKRLDGLRCHLVWR